MNAIQIIAPYRHIGMWVFDDARVGLVQEPFVSGADTIIDELVREIPDAASGFRLLFSPSPFPGHNLQLEWQRGEDGGNWYRWTAREMDGWLCPALFRYFDEAPRNIYAQAMPAADLRETGHALMSWRIVQRKIGSAGSIRQRTARQREWDREYGDWGVGYVIEGVFVPQEEALETVYHRSYAEHFEKHPADLDELIRLARNLRNPHSEATTCVDLQVPAILSYLERNGLKLCGSEMVDIGTFDGRCTHAISVRLSPLTIKCCLDPKMTLEKFWQEKKRLAVYDDTGE